MQRTTLCGTSVGAIGTQKQKWWFTKCHIQAPHAHANFIQPVKEPPATWSGGRREALHPNYYIHHLIWTICYLDPRQSRTDSRWPECVNLHRTYCKPWHLLKFLIRVWPGRVQLRLQLLSEPRYRSLTFAASLFEAAKVLFEAAKVMLRCIHKDLWYRSGAPTYMHTHMNHDNLKTIHSYKSGRCVYLIRTWRLKSNLNTCTHAHPCAQVCEHVWKNIVHMHTYL